MTSSLRCDAEEAKNHPVSKVITLLNRPVSKVTTLLKGRPEQLEKEISGTEEVYDKNECWLARGWHIGGGDPERRFSACRVPSPASKIVVKRLGCEPLRASPGR